MGRDILGGNLEQLKKSNSKSAWVCTTVYTGRELELSCGGEV